MKRKKCISLKAAALMLVGFTALQSLQPIDTLAATQNFTNYYGRLSYAGLTLDQQMSVQTTISREVWLKSIYPEYADLDSRNTSDLIKIWNTIHPEKQLDYNNDTDLTYLYKSGIDSRTPFEGYSSVSKLLETFSNARVEDQYFPTMEFHVGDDFCYVDGKRYELEAPIIRNSAGTTLVPFGNLAYLLSSTPSAPIFYDYNYTLNGDTLSTTILNPWTKQNLMWLYDVTESNPGEEAYSISAHITTTNKVKPITPDSKAYGATVINDVLYVPVRWLAQGACNTTVEWYNEQQIAVIPGQYTERALDYGIFKQPGNTSEYDLFKDWDMIPQQPVRVLTSDLAK